MTSSMNQLVQSKESETDSNIAFIYVVDDVIEEQQVENGVSWEDGSLIRFSSYSRFHLMSTFQLMGCKTNDAHEMTNMIFKWLKEASIEVVNSSNANNSTNSSVNSPNLFDVYDRKRQSINSSTPLSENQILGRINDINNARFSTDFGKNSHIVEYEGEDENDFQNSPITEKKDSSDEEDNTPLVQLHGTSGNNHNNILQQLDLSSKPILNKFITPSKKHTNSMKRAVLQQPLLQQETIPIYPNDDLFGKLRMEQVRNCRSKSETLNQFMKKQVAEYFVQNQQNLGVLSPDSRKTKINILQDYQAQFIQDTIRNRNDILSLMRTQLNEVVRTALAAYDYSRPSKIKDFNIACTITERKRPLIVLFGGTSGCGKSTLASLVASRLGITKVLSTDSVRHMMRSYTAKESNPVLYASTYHAGECLTDPKYAKLTAEEKVLEGYKLQCTNVMEQLEKIITNCEQRNEPLLVEGVHLRTDFIVELMKRHPSVIPFVIYISNEQKHKERFAIRAKYMTLEPRNNKYVKYFENIAIIQRFLCQKADDFKIPKIDNTNIDKSIAVLHFSIFKCLRKMANGESLFNFDKNEAEIPDLPRSRDSVLMSSKRMLKVIRNKRFSLDVNKMQKSTGLDLSTSSAGILNIANTLAPMNNNSINNNNSNPIEEILFAKQKVIEDAQMEISKLSLSSIPVLPTAGNTSNKELTLSPKSSPKAKREALERLDLVKEKANPSNLEESSSSEEENPMSQFSKRTKERPSKLKNARNLFTKKSLPVIAAQNSMIAAQSTVSTNTLHRRKRRGSAFFDEEEEEEEQREERFGSDEEGDGQSMKMVGSSNINSIPLESLGFASLDDTTTDNDTEVFGS